MNIKLVVAPLFKFWWLLLSAALLAMLSSFIVTSQQPLIYQSRATLIVGRAFFEANPSGNDIWLGQQLATYYADIGKRGEVSNAVKEALGLSWLPQYNIRPLPNSLLLEVVVIDTNPARAQVVANAIADQLVEISPTSDQNQGGERRAFIDEQIAYLEKNIRTTLDEIEKAEKDLSELNSVREISETRNKINVLQSKLSQLQANYASLISNTEQGAVNTLSVIERASLPVSPVGPNNLMTILLSAVVAAVVAAGAAYLMELLDDTFKNSDEVTEMLGYPVLASVPFLNAKMDYGSEKQENEKKDIVDRGRKGLRLISILRNKNKQYSYQNGRSIVNGLESKNIFTFIATNPRSAVAEEFRLLRTNLDFMGVDHSLKRIFVTSADPNEGKTYTAINLAIVMSQGGRNVILLDSDLRKPNIAKSLEIPNVKGLSDLLRYDLDPKSVITEWSEGNGNQVHVITTGAPPPNPVDLITSQKMELILEKIDKIADIVIIDGPPMPFSDTMALSKKVDSVLLVISHGQTRRSNARKMIRQLNQVGARIAGLVFNKAPYRSGPYYDYYMKNMFDDQESDPEPEPVN